MTLGRDTSVVVRLLVGLPEAHAEVARRRLERAVETGEVVLVTDLVIADAYHALHHHYGVPKSEARLLLRRFVESGVVRPEPAEARAALSMTGGAGVVDRLIHARHRSLAAVTLTFDRQQGRLEGSVWLRAR